MVVDDNADIRDAMAEMLKLAGYDVVCAENGQDALDQLRSGVRPCLVLLDLEMPVMGGLEFRKEQMHDPDLAGIPIAIYSARDKTDTLPASLRVEHHFQKPIDFGRLFDLVARYCDAPKQSGN
ncbi:MAG TPA: response regulator [Candidatus Binatia bacterium]|nr:response regulator [Candidatus Binatia bacterium]